jgi:hypothetical protein
MKKIIVFVLFFPVISLAASFDCKKASTEHENLICSSQELNEADEKMGDAFKYAVSNFPIKNFIFLSQRYFLYQYRGCNVGKTKQEKINACLIKARDRTRILLELSNSHVYAKDFKKFTIDDLVITVSMDSNNPILRYWGYWMPDPYDPEPFPKGWLCNDSEELKTSNNRLTSKDSSKSIFVYKDRVEIDEIICSARQPTIKGTFPRVN